MADVDAAAWRAAVIEKPQTDHREYRALLLENGLRVVLISDSKCDKSAAALSVRVGTIFDPKEVQGLAHFCEHMLFLGTEKYPKEDDYNEFLAKHAGMSNAYTADSVTNFYFGVSPDHFRGALDRFAQFFLQPLFTESATDRELQAVDSEHSKNQQSDHWRWDQLLKCDANPKHPFCHFGTGNIETLKTIPERDGHPVRDRLLEFHGRYYSSNLMCLAVLGKESFEELEGLVRELFGPVVNKNVAMPSDEELGGGEPTFLCEGWPRLVRVIPVCDVRCVTLQFVLPQQLPARWRTKPTRYLMFLLGHEGKGSLLSALKSKGLATELMAGPSHDEAGFCLYEVCVHLTEKGEAELRSVGEHVFTYIRLLQTLPVSEDLFRETQNIEEMNFRFRSVKKQVAIVSSLSHAMQDKLPIEKVFSGPAKVWELDRAQVVECAGYLTCARMRMLLAMKSLAEAGCCDETERWYGTRYNAGPLPSDLHLAWESRRTGGGGDSTPESAKAAGLEMGLALPLPNPFVAEDLGLRPQPEGGVPPRPWRVLPLPEAFAARLAEACPAAAAGGAPAPSRVVQAYFRQDDTFNLPKGSLSVDVYCPWAAASLERRALTSAWCNCVQEELNELAYDAEVAGLVYNVAGGSRGFSLQFAGYQDKLPVLLRTIVGKMAALGEVSEHTWSLVHTVMVRDAKNAARNRQPHQQAAEWEQRCLHRTATTSGEFLGVVEGLTCEKLRGVNHELLSQCYAEVLLQGNFAAAEVGDMLEALLPILRPATAVAAVPPLAVAALPPGPPGSCVLICRRGTNPEEKNSATIVTLQAAEDALEHVILVELAAQVLGQRCFDELRTKQQLGYIVALQPYSDTGFCGVKVIVQSEKHPAEVHRRIDCWLSAALAELLADGDEALAEYVQALLAVKRERPKTLSEEFVRNRSEVRTRKFRFTRRDEVVAFLERPHADILREFRAFVQERLVPAPRIAARITGAAAADSACGEGAEESAAYGHSATLMSSVEDVETFRSKLVWTESATAIFE